MESLTSSSTSLSELEGISDRIIERLRESGIENVERILELGEDKLKEIPGVGDKTAAKIMEAARDLFEEVEIEVPEGMDLPTAIQAAPANEAEGATEESKAESGAPQAAAPESEESSGPASEAADTIEADDDKDV